MNSYIIYEFITNIESIGRRFAAALLPRLFGTNSRSHHKGATGRVRTGDQLRPGLCHCQLGQDILTYEFIWFFSNMNIHEFIYSWMIISYMNSSRLWIHMIISYMNSNIMNSFAWIYTWIHVTYEFIWFFLHMNSNVLWIHIWIHSRCMT